MFRSREVIQESRSKNGDANTTQGNYTPSKEMAESKYQIEQKNVSEIDQELNAIEREIKDTGDQLENLYYEMMKISNKYSEDYLAMEERRNDLRKRLIDLDYKHKSVFATKMRESQKQEEQEKERIRREVEQKWYDIKRGKEEKAEEGREQNQKLQKKEQQENEALQNSRRKLRIAEIEAQLAQSRLRRSRRLVLDSQLSYLRSSYLYPSYYLRDYYFPSYYYPYYGLYSRWWLY